MFSRRSPLILIDNVKRVLFRAVFWQIPGNIFDTAELAVKMRNQENNENELNTQREHYNPRFSLAEYQSEAIIRACCNEDEQSRKYLYKCSYSFAMGVIVRYIGKGSDAEELVNDSFMKSLRNKRR